MAEDRITLGEFQKRTGRLPTEQEARSRYVPIKKSSYISRVSPYKQPTSKVDDKITIAEQIKINIRNIPGGLEQIWKLGTGQYSAEETKAITTAEFGTTTQKDIDIIRAGEQSRKKKQQEKSDTIKAAVITQKVIRGIPRLTPIGRPITKRESIR